MTVGFRIAQKLDACSFSIDFNETHRLQQGTIAGISGCCDVLNWVDPIVLNEMRELFHAFNFLFFHLCRLFKKILSAAHPH